MQSLDYEKPPLYVAAGGGGDAIAAAMLHNARWPGIPPTIATFAWDRLMVDPLPGPRSTSDFEGLRRIDERNYEITGATRPIPPAGSTLPRLASEVDGTFTLLDPTGGAVGLQDQLAALVETTGANRVEIVDVGGDILAAGTEPELASPLADALALAATDNLAVPVSVLVAGPGLDGELAEATVTSAVEQLDGFQIMRIGPADAAWALPLFDWHPSEATALLIAAARGLRGGAEIRGGGYRLRLTEVSPHVYAVPHFQALSVNRPAQAVAATCSLQEVEAAVRAVCGRSEIDAEREKSRRKRSYNREECSLEVAVDRVQKYGVAAREGGVEYATFRRLAEISNLGQLEAAQLRRRLITRSPSQYAPPLWRF
jgi:hypothetical protein